MAIKHGSKIDSSFGASSMTDMMFLMLLFLMVATTLINPNALRLLLPKSANQIKDKPYTTVSITSDLKYYVETEMVPFNQLEVVLQKKMATVKEPTVSLHCDRTVPVDEVVKVMNIAKNNKFKLILATSPK